MGSMNSQASSASRTALCGFRQPLTPAQVHSCPIHLLELMVIPFQKLQKGNIDTKTGILGKHNYKTFMRTSCSFGCWATASNRGTVFNSQGQRTVLTGAVKRVQRDAGQHRRALQRGHHEVRVAGLQCS